MATAGDGRAPYEGGGAGGKFRKRPFRRSAHATPYDRPPTSLRNNNASLFTNLVNPASRLIYAGAHRPFGVYRKRLPPLPSERPPELSTDQGGNSASISAATGISELEQMLKQMTFTRSEIERLTALLHLRTTESPSDDDVERDGGKPPGTPSHLLPSVAEAADTNATNDKEPISYMSSSPFASTSFATSSTRSSLFGFSCPAATSTTNNQSQGSFFNVASGSQANTRASTAVTQAVPFEFGSSTPSLASGSTGILSSTLGSSFFGSFAPAFSSTPCFGVSSVAASSETKSGSSTSGSTASVCGSAWQPPKSSAFGSTFSSPSSVFSFGASSTPMPSASSSPIMFGSSNTFATAGATNSSLLAPSQGQSVFGNPTPVFGAALGFMFGSANPTPNPNTSPPAVPLQFGGQPNQAPSQNPFQASGSVEYNAGGGSFWLGSGGGDDDDDDDESGGSFWLGSGRGGDKSGRRILRVKNKNRRK